MESYKVIDFVKALEKNKNQTYTKIPNKYFDLMKELDFVDSYVLFLILRFTLGFGKNECVINVTKLAESLKKRRATISKSIKSLESKKIIFVSRGKNVSIRLNEFFIKVHE